MVHAWFWIRLCARSHIFSNARTLHWLMPTSMLFFYFFLSTVCFVLVHRFFFVYMCITMQETALSLEVVAQEHTDKATTTAYSLSTVQMHMHGTFRCSHAFLFQACTLAHSGRRVHRAVRRAVCLRVYVEAR